LQIAQSAPRVSGFTQILADIGAFDDLFVTYPTREESITRMQ
jgi:hypothetical protein